MNPLRMFFMMALLGFAAFAHAEEPKFVSKTFQEIQSRVLHREKESGAILEVKVKEDAPQLNFGLDFSLEEVPHAGEAVIVLSRRTKAGDGVYEKYRLRIDAALRQELQNQKRRKALETQRSVRSAEEQKKNIIQLSAGTLRFGMSLEEVTKVKGQPQKVESWQAVGGFTAIYPDMSLSFWQMKLTSLEVTRQ